MVRVDVADKLNLIPPIAEQCQHQCVIAIVCMGDSSLIINQHVPP